MNSLSNSASHGKLHIPGVDLQVDAGGAPIQMVHRGNAYNPILSPAKRDRAAEIDSLLEPS
jgi:hypothetical protein